MEFIFAIILLFLFVIGYWCDQSKRRIDKMWQECAERAELMQTNHEEKMEEMRVQYHD